MKSRSSSLKLLLFSVAIIAGGAPAARALTIFQVFGTPASNDTWQHYSLPLAPDLWRIAATDADLGSPAAPVATSTEIQTVLGSLGAVEIGGVLTSVVLNTTTYPGGFELSNPNLAGLATDDFVNGNDTGWRATEARAIRATGSGNSGGNPGGTLILQPFKGGEQLVTFLAPAAYLGDKSPAYGLDLSFFLRTISNPFQAPTYRYGIAILSTQVVPEPAVGTFLFLGLGALGLLKPRE